jgi:MraZ protein
VFLGEFEHTIDDKGRVAIPAKFREVLGERFVVTKGFDSCLQAFPMSYWEELSAKVDRLPVSSPDARNLRRLIFSPAQDVDIDRQGRVLIPQTLRVYAGLAEEVVISGMGNYFELWSAARWRDTQEFISANATDIAGKFADLGI